MTKTKVRLYRWTVTRSVSIHETGDNGFNLAPWGKDTDMIQGHDDGGVDYDLPEGYELGSTQFGEPMIYDMRAKNGAACQIMGYAGAPILVSSFGPSEVLKRSR